MKFTDTFVATAGFMGAMPRILRPLIGLIGALPQRYIIAKERKLLRPEFQKRMEKYIQAASEKEVGDPLDHFQMMLRYAQANCPEELNLNDMTIRVAMSNMGSFHQTSIAITNILLNILASDKEYNTISILRGEFASILGTGKDFKWTKACIAKMIHTDSIIRETLRMHSFGNRAALRKVVVNGLKTEDGIALPKGAMVSVLTHPAHCDSEIFSNPTKFDPWRFSRLREAATASDPDNHGSKWSFICTGDQNLSFSLGRHACPGRFILDFELKMIVSYLLMNYDVAFPEEYKGMRPETKWMAEVMVPPGWAKIRLKRRVV
jgi:cytochrome P450